MRRSLLKLLVGSVLLTWAVGLALTFLYARGLAWTLERARADGVFLAHELLAREPPTERAERIRRLRPHFRFDLRLIPLAEAEARIGHPLTPGHAAPHAIDTVAASYFFAFAEGGALTVGPFNPKVPRGFVPVGFILVVIGFPVLAALVVVRLERELLKVERASQALATGELGARVENRRGPSSELAASFNEMAERVERLIRSRDELVQAVSHELGSPLSRLRFHLELLATTTGRAREERLGAMTRDLDALDQLVGELLAYVQADHFEVERALFDARPPLTQIAELAQLELPEERAVRVELDLPSEVMVCADQRLFLRAIENLLRNAVRYASGRVRVTLSSDKNEVRVAVQDDGPGIPEAMREKVLIPFVRLDPGRDRKTGGAGLGLAIVSRIVARHAGRVEILDSPLGGAEVATYWPLDEGFERGGMHVSTGRSRPRRPLTPPGKSSARPRAVRIQRVRARSEFGASARGQKNCVANRRPRPHWKRRDSR